MNCTKEKDSEADELSDQQHRDCSHPVEDQKTAVEKQRVESEHHRVETAFLLVTGDQEAEE